MTAAEAPAGTTGRCFQGVDRNDFGYKMLQSMGWSEGKVGGVHACLWTRCCGRRHVAALTPRARQGLGASESGITKHIAAVKRQEQIGVCRWKSLPAQRCTDARAWRVLQALAPTDGMTRAPRLTGR